MSLVIAALILIQDPVPELLARIDGRDPEACFRAIGELADLEPDRRADIEKGAERLPEFYRLALLAELRAKSPVKRVSLEGKGRTGPSYLEELGPLCSEVYWKAWKDGEIPNAKFDLSLKNVPALEALRRICIEGQCLPLPVTSVYGRTRNGWGFAGRRALVIHHYSHLYHSVKMGAKPASRAWLEFSMVAEPGVRIVSFKDVRVLEAVAKGGRVLDQVDADLRTAVDWDEEAALGHAEEWKSWLSLNLVVPRDIEAIDRLKFTAVALTTTSICDLEIPFNEPGKTGDVSKDGFTVQLPDAPKTPRSDAEYRIRIRSDRHTREELLRLPMYLEYAGGASQNVWVGLRRIRPAEGRAVDYVFEMRADELKGPFKIRIRLPSTLEELPVFAEFRDIPLK